MRCFNLILVGKLYGVEPLRRVIAHAVAMSSTVIARTTIFQSGRLV